MLTMNKFRKKFSAGIQKNISLFYDWNHNLLNFKEDCDKSYCVVEIPIDTLLAMIAVDSTSLQVCENMS